SAARSRRGADIPSGQRDGRHRVLRARARSAGARAPRGRVSAVPERQMNKPDEDKLLAQPDLHEAWQQDYARSIGADKQAINRSGIAIQPLYTERDWNPADRIGGLGLPGQPPYTRGIYPTMHRGRTWTQRQLIGLGTPAEYNVRLREVLAQGATALSLIPCNSVFRGYDMDESHIELL